MPEAKLQEAIFHTLYEKYKNPVYGYVLAITHSPHTAEEITQEIFMKLWEYPEKISGIAEPQHYFFVMARNKTLNYLRKAANNKKVMDELQYAMKPAENNIEELMFAGDYEDVLGEALRYLSPQRSRVFRLSRYQGLKLEEIAEQMQLSKNTVKNHLVAALRFIRTYLIRHGITLLWLSLLLF